MDGCQKSIRGTCYNLQQGGMNPIVEGECNEEQYGWFGWKPQKTQNFEIVRKTIYVQLMRLVAIFFV